MFMIKFYSFVSMISAGVLVLSILPAFTQFADEKERIADLGIENSFLLPDSFDSENRSLQLSKIKHLVELGLKEEALQLADQIVEKDPDDYMAWATRAGLRITLGWQTNIQWDAWYGLALNDNQPHSYRLLGVSFTRLKRLDDAQHMLSIAEIWEDAKARKLLQSATAELNALNKETHAPTGRRTLQEGQQAYEVRNFKRAFILFLKAAESGNSSAMGNVAHMYSKGLGTIVEKDSAAFWFKKAAENGAREAMYRYSKILNNKNRGPADQIGALHWLKKSAEYGYTRALFEMGSAYKWGDGVTKDSKLAVAYFRAAAEQNHSRALYFLGRMFETGEGVPHIASKAAEFMAEAVYQQDELAILQLTQFSHQWSKSFRYEMQIILRELGFYNGMEDGNFDIDTITAIKALASDG